MCVDHKDLVRRTDEKWKRAPFRMLLYILWEVKCQVYSFWPHLKTSPTTFFDWSCRSGVSLFFTEQNEQAQYSAHLQAFKTITKTNTERTLPNKNEQKTNGANSISTAFEALCSVVRRGSGCTLELMLTPAPRCPVRRFRVSARVNSPPRDRVGKFRLTVHKLASSVSLWTALDRSRAAQTL